MWKVSGYFPVRPSCLAVLSQWTARGASTHFTCESKLLPMDTLAVPARHSRDRRERRIQLSKTGIYIGNPCDKTFETGDVIRFHGYDLVQLGFLCFFRAKIYKHFFDVDFVSPSITKKGKSEHFTGLIWTYSSVDTANFWWLSWLTTGETLIMVVIDIIHRQLQQ